MPYIIAPVLLYPLVTVGVCWFSRKKKREDSYDVEKSRAEDEVETPFSEEQNSLLDEIDIKSAVYISLFNLVLISTQEILHKFYCRNLNHTANELRYLGYLCVVTVMVT